MSRFALFLLCFAFLAISTYALNEEVRSSSVPQDSLLVLELEHELNSGYTKRETINVAKPKSFSISTSPDSTISRAKPNHHLSLEPSEASELAVNFVCWPV